MAESYFEDATITIREALTQKKYFRTQPYTGDAKINFFKSDESQPFFSSKVQVVDGTLDKAFSHKLPAVDKKEPSYDLRVTCTYKDTNKLLLTAKIWPKKAKVLFQDTQKKPLKQFPFLVKQEGVDDQHLATDGEGKCTVSLLARGTYVIALAGVLRITKSEQVTEGEYRDHKFTVDKSFKAKFVSPDITLAAYKDDADASPAKKQWVNLKSATDDHKPGCGCDAKGNLVVFTVTADPADASMAGEKVYFEVNLGKESKRNFPKPCVRTEIAVQDKKEANSGKKTTGYVELSLDDNDAPVGSFEVDLGFAGGDTCEVKIGSTNEVKDAKLKLINWRKIYAQITKTTAITSPSLASAQACFRPVNIELEECTADEVNLTDVDVPPGAIVDGTKLEAGKPIESLVVGDHNVTSFKAFLNNRFKTEDLPVAHLIYCDFQVDANGLEINRNRVISGSAKVDFPGGGRVRGLKLDGASYGDNSLLFSIDLTDGTDAVKSCTWEEEGGTGASGDVTSTDYLIDHVAHGNFMYIRLPAAANNLAATGSRIKLRYRVARADGWYNGWCTSVDRHLVIRVGRPDNDICGTIVHEIGHAIVQAPAGGTEVSFPGLTAPPHSRFYTNNRGHQGPHCADGLNQTDYDDVSFRLDSDKASDECTCVMFGAGSDVRNANLAFCAKCIPYVKAVKITSVSI